VRQPNQKKPPDRVGHEFGDDEGPGLAVLEQAAPGQLRFGDRRWLRGDRIVGGWPGKNGCTPGRKPLGAFTRMIKWNPENQPKQSRGSGENECPLPTPSSSDGRHECRSNDGPDVRAGI